MHTLSVLPINDVLVSCVTWTADHCGCDGKVSLCHFCDDFFLHFRVWGHSHCQAILKVSDTYYNLNEHMSTSTSKGRGKGSDTHRYKGLKLSAIKEGTKELHISSNSYIFPGPKTGDGMWWHLLHLTQGIVQIIINTFSARKCRFSKCCEDRAIIQQVNTVSLSKYGLSEYGRVLNAKYAHLFFKCKYLLTNNTTGVRISIQMNTLMSCMSVSHIWTYWNRCFVLK